MSTAPGPTPQRPGQDRPPQSSREGRTGRPGRTGRTGPTGGTRPRPLLVGHLRNVAVAYAVAALAVLLIFVLTGRPVVLAVLAVLLVIGVGHVVVLHRGGVSDAVHHQARSESVARAGNLPPERPRGI